MAQVLGSVRDREDRYTLGVSAAVVLVWRWERLRVVGRAPAEVVRSMRSSILMVIEKHDAAMAVAGCMAGDDYGAWNRLPDTSQLRNEVANPRGHYISYTPQWTAAGARLVEYGQSGALKSFK